MWIKIGKDLVNLRYVRRISWTEGDSCTPPSIWFSRERDLITETFKTKKELLNRLAELEALLLKGT